MSDRAPVLVGVAQLLQRVEDPSEAKQPLELMVDAVRAAADDSGAPALIGKTSSIRVVKGIWGYKNAARGIAEALGCGQVETGVTVLGGNHVQMVLNQSALDIQEGRHEVVVLAGAECGRTIGRARKAGLELDWCDRARRHRPDRASKPAEQLFEGQGKPGYNVVR